MILMSYNQIMQLRIKLWWQMESTLFQYYIIFKFFNQIFLYFWGPDNQLL